MGAGVPTLPAVAARLGGRKLGVRLAPVGAGPIPRFDEPAHLRALAADPAQWPARTGAVSLLALELTVPRTGLAASLPARTLRLELLDYPGEWLLDLPLLATDFPTWSDATLQRLESRPAARSFLQFSAGLAANAPRDEALAAAGHRLYREALHRLRDEEGLAYLQPGRFLMPAPGADPPWTAFFPSRGRGGLVGLLTERYDAYRDAVRQDLVSPLFGNLDRLVVLADLLTALHTGRESFADAQSALSAAAGALRWRFSWTEVIGALLMLRRPPPVIRRVAYAATKVDHVASRQRGNLRTLMAALTPAGGDVATRHFALASIRCTEDATMRLDGRSVSAVRGRIAGQGVGLSYPGEVPDSPPDDAFWGGEFFDLPQFEPTRLPGGGRAGVPQIELDALIAFLLDDLL
jgi:predicted YcjX-like family ATPase